MGTSLLAIPRLPRLARTAGWTAALAMSAAAAWFFWFDAWFALNHSLGALQAMNDAAQRLEAKGDLVEAENLLRESLAIRERRAFKGLDFGAGEQLALDAASHLAFVVLERGRLAEAARIHDELINRAARTLGKGPYERYAYARLRSRHGELLLRIGNLTQARLALEDARAALADALRGADVYLQPFIENARMLNEQRLQRAQR